MECVCVCVLAYVIWIGTIFVGSSPMMAACGGGAAGCWATDCVGTSAGGCFYSNGIAIIEYFLK